METQTVIRTHRETETFVRRLIGNPLQKVKAKMTYWDTIIAMKSILTLCLEYHAKDRKIEQNTSDILYSLMQEIVMQSEQFQINFNFSFCQANDELKQFYQNEFYPVLHILQSRA